MERLTKTNLHARQEELARAVVEEANRSRPFFIQPGSTIAGLPRLAPEGAELGGWATLLLLSPHASGGLARTWRLTNDPDARFAIPLPTAGGTSLRGISPFAGILPERHPFPSAVLKNLINACLKSHAKLLEEHAISKAQLEALVGLFLALGNNNVFRGDWVGGYTRASLELAAGLAWSVLLLSKPMPKQNLPGHVFPAELRVSGQIEERGITLAPSGIWGFSGRERVDALRRARGRSPSDAIKQGANVVSAWNGSLFLAGIGGNPSGEPVSDWREVGRRLVVSLRNLDFGALDRVEAQWPLVHTWKRLIAKHRHTSIPHLIHTLRYRDLLRDGRWDRSILVPRLREVQQPDEPLPDIPLGRLGPSRLLAALRKRAAAPVEADLLELLENEVFERDPMADKTSTHSSVDTHSLGERWSAILTAMPSPRYERRPRRKSSGGIRFLDVPNPKLASVLFILEAALRPVFPPNT